MMIATMKTYRGKLPLPMLAGIMCGLAFCVLLYNERITFLSATSLARFSSCARRAAHDAATGKAMFFSPGVVRSDFSSFCSIWSHSFKPEFFWYSLNVFHGRRAKIDGMKEEHKLEYDADICDISEGKWVYNRSIKPLYSDRICPYLDRQVSCIMNGRPDFDYRHWQWQPDECSLPRFDPKRALRKLKGKRLLFVGDSLQRGQWQSFVCLVESIIPNDQKSMKRGRVRSVFRAKEYNATIEFYWAPFLVESNSDLHIIGDPRKRILKVDSIAKHAKHWLDVDFLVFNTYVWWMSGLKINSLWGSFANGEEGYEELDAPVAYRLGLKTWANWVDSTIDSNKTRVFFTTMSPTHMRPVEWNNKDGIKCFNETRPVKKRGHWGSGSDKRIMKVVGDVLGKMKVHVTVLNVTQLSEYRVDAHTKVYTETGGKLLTDEQKADPLHHADCIHWCLPGVPDTWNQIFLAHL